MKSLSMILVLVGLMVSSVSFADVFSDAAMKMGDVYGDGVITQNLDCEAMRWNERYARRYIGRSNSYYDLNKDGKVWAQDVLAIVNWVNSYCNFSGSYDLIRPELKAAFAHFDASKDGNLALDERTVANNRLHQLVMASKGMYSNSANGQRVDAAVNGSAYELCKAFTEFDFNKDGAINEQDEFIAKNLVDALKRVYIIRDPR